MNNKKLIHWHDDLTISDEWYMCVWKLSHSQVMYRHYHCNCLVFVCTRVVLHSTTVISWHTVSRLHLPKNQALNLPAVYFIRGAKSRAFDNYWRWCWWGGVTGATAVTRLTFDAWHTHTHAGASTQPPLPRRPGQLFNGHYNCTWFQYSYADARWSV